MPIPPRGTDHFSATTIRQMKMSRRQPRWALGVLRDSARSRALASIVCPENPLGAGDSRNAEGGVRQDHGLFGLGDRHPRDRFANGHESDHDRQRFVRHGLALLAYRLHRLAKV